MYGNTLLDRRVGLSRLMDESFENRETNGTRTSDARIWYPATDAFETREAYVVETDLPGVKGEDVEISFERNTLTIRGPRQWPLHAAQQNGAEFRVHGAERVGGSFSRAIRLPEYVDGEKIEASFNDGVLTVRVPKAQSALPRKIEVKVGTGSAQQQIS
jgi:HSP20 family protein